MNTFGKAGALMLGAILAAGLAGCKDRSDDTPAPVTPPDTTAPTPPPATPPVMPPEAAPVTPTTPPSDGTMPPPDTTSPPASGSSGTQGTQGSGQPSNTAPDKVDREPQRDRRPTY